MWSDFKPLALSREQFSHRLAELQWSNWHPKGIVLHNTAAPTLAQWAESGPNHDARIRNLEGFYEGKGWKGGPHWFVSRTVINEFNNPLRQGTHSPSFNKTHFGIEMVGDYSSEVFDAGDGAKVRDNAVFLMAALCKRFGWDPGEVIKFHKEDPATNHDCPGANVHKPDIIARVKAAMGISKEHPTPALPEHPVIAGVQEGIYATEFGGGADEQEASYGGRVDPNKPGVALPFKFRGPRQRVMLSANGQFVVADIIDVGPWNIDDPYWKTGARPLSEHQFESGEPDFKGRKVRNKAGIDLTRAAMDALHIPGKIGTRSTLLDWQFTDQLSPPVWKPAPAPESEVDEDRQAPSKGNGKLVDVITVEVIQRRLNALGYHEVGTIDGKFGSRSAAAISAFKHDRGIDPPVGEIDDTLTEALVAAEAENWQRPIAEPRKKADEAEVEKHAPEIAPVKENRFAAFWGAISVAFMAAVNALADHFQEGLSFLTQGKDYLNQVPGWLWLVAVAGVLLYFYLKSRQSAAQIVDSYRKGEHN